MNTKLHAVTGADGRPLSLFMTAGQVSDYTGAAALLDDLPKAHDEVRIGAQSGIPQGASTAVPPPARFQFTSGAC